jgi:hypothetical protein
MDMDLFLLNKLSQLKDGPSSSSGGSGSAFLDNTDTVVSAERLKPIATVVAQNQRGSGPGYNWTSSLPIGSFYTRGSNSESVQAIFFAPRAKVDMQKNQNGAYRNVTASTQNNGSPNGLEFAGDRFVGSPIMGGNQNWDSSYSPFISRIMFLRNTTPQSRSVDVNSYFSVKYQSGHDGAALILYTPNAENFTDVTSVTSTIQWDKSGSGWIDSQGTTISIPAKRTVAVVLCNTCHNWTGFNNGEWTYNFNGFYALNNTITNGVECDMKATEAYAKMCDSSFVQNPSGNENIIKCFNNIGRMYGNWEYT